MRRGETTFDDAAVPQGEPVAPGAASGRATELRGALARLRDLIAGRVARDLLGERRAAPRTGDGPAPTS